jgi:hypothetical protein
LNEVVVYSLTTAGLKFDSGGFLCHGQRFMAVEGLGHASRIVRIIKGALEAEK